MPSVPAATCAQWSDPQKAQRSQVNTVQMQQRNGLQTQLGFRHVWTSLGYYKATSPKDLFFLWAKISEKVFLSREYDPVMKS